MFDVYEEFGIIEPLKRGETEGIVNLLRSDGDISPKVRAALADFLEDPPKKKKGAPPADPNDRMLLALKICRTYMFAMEKGDKPGEALEKVCKLKGLTIGKDHIRDMIYCKQGDKKFEWEWHIMHALVKEFIKRKPRLKK